MPPPARRRRKDQHVGVIDMICVVVVLVSFVALVIWIVSTAGGGVLNQG